MKDSHVVKEHYMTHNITEVEHIPDHDSREETLTFRNAKNQAEKVEHLGCFICGIMEKRESHHIFERCWANGFDYKKVAHALYNYFDFHGHCKRDFKSEADLLQYFVDHFSKTGEDGVVFIDDDALDTLYNQLILCKYHHRDEGHSAHGSSFATMIAWFAHKDGFQISMSKEEYEAMPHSNT